MPHSAIVCQETGQTYWQLNNLQVKEQATISVCNSSLSEAAVLGFEYGYSLSNEMALTLWEGELRWEINSHSFSLVPPPSAIR